MHRTEVRQVESRVTSCQEGGSSNNKRQQTPKRRVGHQLQLLFSQRIKKRQGALYNDQRQGSANGGKEEGFGKKLPNQTALANTYNFFHRHLLLPQRSLGSREVHKVDTGDQQHQ